MELAEKVSNEITEMVNSSGKNAAIITAVAEASYQVGYDNGLSKGCKVVGAGVAMGLLVGLIGWALSKLKKEKTE